MSNNQIEKDENIVSDYVSEAILNEDLTGTHDKALSDEAKAEVMKFLSPILYGFYGLVALLSVIIVYFSFRYLFGIESIFISCVLVIVTGVAAFLLRKTIVSVRIVIGIVMGSIIYSVVFRYLLYDDYVKSMYVISSIAVVYIVCNGLMKNIFTKFYPIVAPINIAVIVLVVIKYFKHGIAEFTLYSVMSATAIITLLLFFSVKIRKDKFTKRYTEIRSQDD